MRSRQISMERPVLDVWVEKKMESLKIPQQRSKERNGSNGTITDPSVALRKSAGIETKVIKGAKSRESRSSKIGFFFCRQHQLAEELPKRKEISNKIPVFRIMSVDYPFCS